MIYYKPGSVVEMQQKKNSVKYLLLSYLGEFRRQNRQSIFKLKQPLDDGRDTVYFEVWNCQDLETGLKDVKKFPVYIYQETDDDDNHSEKDRLETIDDRNEVTSLLDNYSCWLNYCQTNESIRNGFNWHRKLVNQKHSEQIYRLKELDSNSTLDKNLRVGVRLKLIQKESPNHYTHRDLLNWKQEFPELFTKISNYVYKDIDPILPSNSL